MIIQHFLPTGVGKHLGDVFRPCVGLEVMIYGQTMVKSDSVDCVNKIAIIAINN